MLKSGCSADLSASSTTTMTPGAARTFRNSESSFRKCGFCVWWSASGSGSAGHATSILDASDAVRLIPEVSPKGILRAPSGDPDAATSSMLMASSSMWLGNSSVAPGAMTPTHPSITVRSEVVHARGAAVDPMSRASAVREGPERLAVGQRDGLVFYEGGGVCELQRVVVVAGLPGCCLPRARVQDDGDVRRGCDCAQRHMPAVRAGKEVAHAIALECTATCEGECISLYEVYRL